MAGLFSQYPITVLNDFDSELQVTVRSLLHEQSFDLLICDFLQPSLNVMEDVEVPTILFQHNVEAEIPYRHFLHAPWWLRWFWHNQWKKMERFERQAATGLTGSLPFQIMIESF